MLLVVSCNFICVIAVGDEVNDDEISAADDTPDEDEDDEKERAAEPERRKRGRRSKRDSGAAPPKKRHYSRVSAVVETREYVLTVIVLSVVTQHTGVDQSVAKEDAQRDLAAR